MGTLLNRRRFFVAEAWTPPPTPSTFSGLRIMHKDGGVYTQAEWTAGGFPASDGIGVAYGDGTSTTGHRFCLYKTFMQNTPVTCRFTSSNTYLIPSPMTTTTTYATAVADYGGKANSQAVLTALANHNLTDAPVCTYCDNILSPWREHGYCPSAGQMLALYNNASDLNTLLALIDGDTFVTTSTQIYWTSTQYNTNIMWAKYNNLNYQVNKYLSGNNYRGLAVFDY